MHIGVPKEIKTQEYWVGMVPGSVREVVHHGHAVMVECDAGRGVGFGAFGEAQLHRLFERALAARIDNDLARQTVAFHHAGDG